MIKSKYIVALSFSRYKFASNGKQKYRWNPKMPNLTTTVVCLLHWSNQMVDNWNVQRAEISNLSENNLVTALSLGRLTLLELVMSRSHQSSWKILFDGSRTIKSVYETLKSRNFCTIQMFALWAFHLEIFKPRLARF